MSIISSSPAATSAIPFQHTRRSRHPTSQFSSFAYSHSSRLASASSFTAASSTALRSMPIQFELGSRSGPPKHHRRVAYTLSAAQASSEPGGTVTEYDDGEALEKRIQEGGDKLIVLDISTTTCGPCKFIYPKLVKLSSDYPDAIFLKVHGDLNSSTRALMKKWGVRAVPNFRFFRNGKQIHSHTGANEDELRAHFMLHYERASV